MVRRSESFFWGFKAWRLFMTCTWACKWDLSLSISYLHEQLYENRWGSSAPKRTHVPVRIVREMWTKISTSNTLNFIGKRPDRRMRLGRVQPTS